MNYFPGSELIGKDEMRITFVGSGPFPPGRDQAGTCIMVELGNGDRFFFDFGPGCVKNFLAMGVPVARAATLRHQSGLQLAVTKHSARTRVVSTSLSAARSDVQDGTQGEFHLARKPARLSLSPPPQFPRLRPPALRCLLLYPHRPGRQ